MVSKQALMNSTYSYFSTTTTSALCHYPNILFYNLFSSPWSKLMGVSIFSGHHIMRRVQPRRWATGDGGQRRQGGYLPGWCLRSLSAGKISNIRFSGTQRRRAVFQEEGNITSTLPSRCAFVQVARFLTWLKIVLLKCFNTFNFPEPWARVRLPEEFRNRGKDKQDQV